MIYSRNLGCKDSANREQYKISSLIFIAEVQPIFVLLKQRYYKMGILKKLLQKNFRNNANVYKAKRLIYFFGEVDLYMRA